MNKIFKIKKQKINKTMKRVILASNGPRIRGEKKFFQRNVDNSFKRINCHLENCSGMMPCKNAV